MTYESEVLADAPILYWRLGETSGTTAVDSSGNGNDGTYTSPTMHTPSGLVGDADGAAAIADPTDVVTTPVGPSYLLVDYSAFTLEIVVQVSDYGSGSQLWGSSPGAPYFALNPGFNMAFASEGATVSASAPDLDTPYHLCATYDGTDLILYVNGIAVDTEPASGIQIFGDPGAYWNVGYDGGDATGTYDEAAFYDYALDATRVEAHATAAGLFVPPSTAPTVTNVDPNEGSFFGGTFVTLTGTNFTGVTAVTFGDTDAPDFIFDSDTQIFVYSPEHVVGAVNITVTTPEGTSATGGANTFTYIYIGDPCTITSMSPQFGPTGGGTSVDIHGSGFLTGPTVTFGGVVASVGTYDDTHIVADSPPHAVGTVDVVATNSGGPSATGPDTEFTYESDEPTVTSVDPTFGPAADYTEVVITGTKFTTVTDVSFGGITAEGWSVDSDTQISTAASPHAAGVVHVTVTTLDGTSATSAADEFTYVGPTVSSISPTTGPVTGGTSVVVTGTNFTGTTSVVFGASSASLTVDSDTQITATSPAHAAGTVDVRVTTPDGTSATSGADLFTYTVDIVVDTYQWQLDTIVYGGGSNGLWLEKPIDGLGVPDAKTQDVVWTQRAGAYANPDYVSVRVITIPAIIKAATEADAAASLAALELDWTSRPVDAQLAFNLPGWDAFYVMGRPRSVKADLTHSRRGVIRVLLRFDCPNPEVVFV